MTNPIIDVIHHHGSVRQYQPDPIPPETISAIVAAAQRTSTSSNMQAYSVIAVTNAATRTRLAELCSDQAHIAQAPVFLAWCADLARLDRACTLRGYTQVTEYVENFLIAAIDTAMAAQTAALAAESMGLGMCYIGAIRNRPAEVIELLGLPQFTFPITGMTLGWPAIEPPIRPRLPQSAVLHWERYQTDQDAQLAAYDQAMVATGIYGGRQVPVSGQPNQMADYGWTEHSARRVSQPTRIGLRAILEAQGFDLK